MGSNKKRSRRGGRSRFKNARDALEQLEGIGKAQRARRKKKSKQIIDSIKKSEDRFRNKLQQLNGASVDEVKNAFE